jgi:hypothetical protein
MEYDFENKLTNGNTIYYKVYNDIYFSVGIKLKDGTVEEYSQVNEALMKLICNYSKNPWRVRIWYGNPVTGEAWNEEYDVTGHIGVTTGKISIPILVHNKRSWGGGAILVGSIIRIDDIEDHKTIWKVDNFHVNKMTVVHKPELIDFPYQVYQEKNGSKEHIASFQTEDKAERYIAFMNGKRYSK